MRVPIATAGWESTWEADLVARLESADSGLVVVRRCVDVADLLACAAGGTIRAVIVSAGLPRLDLEVLHRLRACDVAVVGVATRPDDDRRLRQLGVQWFGRADDDPRSLAALVSAALRSAAQEAAASPAAAGRGELSGGVGVPGPALEGREAGWSPEPVSLGEGSQLIAVWGPTGAPGRTSVAIGLAAESAALGHPTLLIDADTYGGSVAQLLGLLDEAPGLAAAVRHANAGTLDVPALRRLAPVVVDNLRVLTGISRPERWPELRVASLRSVYALARQLAETVVVDCGFCLEDDDELSYDTLAPRRNAVTLVTVADADQVVAVGSADPIGLHRLIRGIDRLREIVPDAAIRVVVNRLRRGPISGPHVSGQIRAELAKFASVTDVFFIPDDRPAFDRAVADGRLLRECAPKSPAVRAFAQLAGMVLSAGRTGSA